MSVPAEVEKALDERSKYGILGGTTDVMMKYAAAEAMKSAAANPGMGGAFMGAGVGLGAGAQMGSVFADAMNPSAQPQAPAANGAAVAGAAVGAAAAGATKVCPKCGYYDGKQVVDVSAKEKKD